MGQTHPLDQLATDSTHMNMTTTLNNRDDREEEINFGALLDTIYLERKLVGSIALGITSIALLYALVASPIYEADLAVQVEDSPASASSMLGDAASMFDTKTAASAEMVLLQSRMVIAKAVDNLQLNIDAKPQYLPVLGSWLARRSKEFSKPILGGYVTGNEEINVTTFNVPKSLWDEKFTLTKDEQDGYTLTLDKYDVELQGKVGVALKQETAAGTIELTVSKLTGNPGASYQLAEHSRLKTLEDLQDAIKIAEKGKSSGVIGITLDGNDPELTARILNEIGFEYIRQNVHRKAEEAQKTLDFLDKELPRIKLALEAAENRYNRLRDTRGTINISEEGKGLLDMAVGIEVKLGELKQKRDELLIRFTNQHPSVVTVDGQIRILDDQKAALQTQIKKLPSLQQDMLGLERDVKVNTELYTSLLNTSQQLNLLKASKIGTARMIDVAEVPESPIKPKRPLIVVIGLILGLFIGVAVVLIRKAMHGGIDNPKGIEDATGLSVYATILESEQQEQFAKQIKAKQPGTFILAESHPDDLSVESLRSFRVALQFAMLDASNNRIMITGATPGIGKSFISANLSTILAQAGKRVLLIDMDLHKGHLNQYFGLPRNGGISDLLAADKKLEEVTHKGVLNNLDFITIGTRVSNPSSLFLTERLTKILEQASELYDVVLIDAPPVLLVSDVSVIGPNIGTTFLVVRDSITTIPDIIASQKRLAQAQVQVKGVLFNGQLKRVSSAYGYGYGYGYKYSNYKQSNME